MHVQTVVRTKATTNNIISLGVHGGVIGTVSQSTTLENRDTNHSTSITPTAEQTFTGPNPNQSLTIVPSSSELSSSIPVVNQSSLLDVLTSHQL